MKPDEVFLVSDFPLYNNIANIDGFYGNLQVSLSMTPYPGMVWEFEVVESPERSSTQLKTHRGRKDAFKLHLEGADVYGSHMTPDRRFPERLKVTPIQLGGQGDVWRVRRAGEAPLFTMKWMLEDRHKRRKT